MTRTGADARPTPSAQDRHADNFAEWVRLNTRALLIAGAVVLLAVVGYWIYDNAQDAKVVQAEEALARASQSIATGNVPLAITDLERVVNQFGGTPGARDAALLLAQLRYERGEFKEGIAVLQEVVDDGLPGAVAAPMYVLIADGQVELAQFAEAASAYLRAAELTPYAAEQSADSASAARAFAAAGDTARAVAIWEALVESENPLVQNEARLRLGELQARPATAS